jgi:hypothetical protein
MLTIASSYEKAQIKSRQFIVTTWGLIYQECGTAIAKARDTPFTDMLLYDAAITKL